MSVTQQHTGMEIETLYTTVGVPAASAWVLKKLCGPALEVAGEILADRARLWRFKNFASILDEAGEYASRAGLDLKRIPLKALFPLLEGASLEEELDLRSKWARLLANGSATGASISITGIAGDFLRAVSAADVKLLDALYSEVTASDWNVEAARWGNLHGNASMAAETPPSGPFRLVSRARLIEKTGLDLQEFELCFDNITRFNIIETPRRHNLDGAELDLDHYAFTRLGWKVIKLLQPAQPNRVSQG